MKLALLAALLLASGELGAASLTLPGLCPGYSIALDASHTLIVRNGACSSRTWQTIRVVGMCRGRRFSAKAGSLGNLYISCVS